MQIGQRESLRRKLAELEERLGPSLLGRVLDELETLVARLSSEAGAGKEKAAPERREEIPLRDPFADLLANLHLPEPEPLAGKPPLAIPPAPEATPLSVPPPAEEKKSPEPPREREKRPLESPPPRVEAKKSSFEAPPPRVEAKKSSLEAPPAPRESVPALPAAPREKEERRPQPPPVPRVPAEEPREPAVPVRPVERPPVVAPPSPPAPVAEEKKPAAEPQGKAKPDFSAYLPKPILLRSAYPLEEGDVLYMHAVGQIPLEEKPASEPFILEEKGLESKEFVFAVDRGGLRFYLSRLTGKTTNVSKTGMLLLSRKESIQLRGTHFSILNDLRVHGLLLPFEFGTMALGRDDLHAKIDEHGYELRDALEELVATRWWEVCVYSLDMKMMSFVAPDAPASRRAERDRRGVDRAGASGSRIDIKTLERILNKQKTLAEEIHRQLEGLSVRSDVDMMVNLSSGSSDDWKPILRASYEVGSPEIYRFNHTITDLQYHHLKYQLMFVLTGDREDFSFQQA